MSSVRINSSEVPHHLWSLIPLAEKFGVSDDLTRETAIKYATEEEKCLLKDAVREFDDELDAWLAGPEAGGPTYSDGYIAFSALRMAADYT